MDGSDHIVSAIVTSVSSGRRSSCVGLHDDVLQKILLRTREWYVVICDYHEAHQCHHEMMRSNALVLIGKEKHITMDLGLGRAGVEKGSILKPKFINGTAYRLEAKSEVMSEMAFQQLHLGHLLGLIMCAWSTRRDAVHLTQ